MMKNFTCLLIEDDPDDREIFEIALEDVDEPVSYTTANNGVDGLKILKEDQSFLPDFIFLDLNMPLMSGKECLEEIKLIPRLKDVPVIIYTTSSHENDIHETRELGASHFLTKPASITRLTEMLTSIFAQKELPYTINRKS